MTTDLDQLSQDVETYLAENRLLIFHGVAEPGNASPVAYWDVEQYPDFRDFLELGRQLGARMVTLHTRRLTSQMLDDLAEELEEADVDEREYRDLWARLRSLRAYEGLVGTIELSYVVDGVTYVYRRRAGWYLDFQDLAEEIEQLAYPADEPEEDEPEIDDFFSRN